MANSDKNKPETYHTQERSGHRRHTISANSYGPTRTGTLTVAGREGRLRQFRRHHLRSYHGWSRSTKLWMHVGLKQALEKGPGITVRAADPLIAATGCRQMSIEEPRSQQDAAASPKCRKWTFNGRPTGRAGTTKPTPQAEQVGGFDLRYCRRPQMAVDLANLQR